MTIETIALLLMILFLLLLGGCTGLLFCMLKSFREFTSQTDVTLMGMAGEMKKIETNMTEILLEQRRISRLTIEQLDLKKAEMTGDFEIVEETIPAPPEVKMPEIKGFPGIK